jgi:hypothetical protein
MIVAMGLNGHLKGKVFVASTTYCVVKVADAKPGLNWNDIHPPGQPEFRPLMIADLYYISTERYHVERIMLADRLYNFWVLDGFGVASEADALLILIDADPADVKKCRIR